MADTEKTKPGDKVKDVTISMNTPTVTSTAVSLSGTVQPGAQVRVTVVQFENGSVTDCTVAVADPGGGNPHLWTASGNNLTPNKHHSALAMGFISGDDESGVTAKRFKTPS